MKAKTFLPISPGQYLKLIYFDQRIMFTAPKADIAQTDVAQTDVAQPNVAQPNVAQPDVLQLALTVPK